MAIKTLKADTIIKLTSRNPVGGGKIDTQVKKIVITKNDGNRAEWKMLELLSHDGVARVFEVGGFSLAFAGNMIQSGELAEI